MAVRGAVWPWLEMLLGPVAARSHRRSEAARALAELLGALAAQIDCRLACVAWTSGEAMEILAVWPRANDAGLTEGKRLPADPGAAALTSGEVDAVLYAKAATAQSPLARALAKAGCSSAVLVPLEGAGGQRLVLAVGLTAPIDELADQVGELLAMLSPTEMSAVHHSQPHQ